MLVIVLTHLMHSLAAGSALGSHSSHLKRVNSSSSKSVAAAALRPHAASASATGVLSSRNKHTPMSPVLWPCTQAAADPCLSLSRRQQPLNSADAAVAATAAVQQPLTTNMQQPQPLPWSLTTNMQQQPLPPCTDYNTTCCCSRSSCRSHNDNNSPCRPACAVSAAVAP